MPDTLFAAPRRVKRLQIEITTACNLSCAGCPRTIGVKKGEWRNRQMGLDLYREVIAQAPPAGTLVLHGIGEPTLHPGLGEMVDAARAAGKFGAIAFTTNALVRDASYFADLRQRGLSRVNISADSLDPETAAFMRQGTDCAALEKSIRDLVALFGGDASSTVVLSRRNLPLIATHLQKLHNFGVRFVEVVPLADYGVDPPSLCLSQDEIEGAGRAIRRAAASLSGMKLAFAATMVPDGTRCRLPFHAVYVTVDGHLTPCFATDDIALWGKTRLVKRSFAEAWAGDAVAGWLERYFDTEPQICRGCAFNPSGMRASRPRVSEGLALFNRGKTEEAEKVFAAITEDRETAEAFHRRGLLMLERGDAKEAAVFLEAAYAVQPQPRTANNLAAALLKVGRKEEAAAILEKVVHDHPLYANAHFQLANIRKTDGAVQAASNLVGGFMLRTLTTGGGRQVSPAMSVLMSIDAEPDNLLSIGNLLRLEGRQDDVRPLLARRIARAPNDFGARLTHAMTELAIVHQTEEEIDRRRAAYTKDIQELDELTQAAPQARLAASAGVVGMAKPFFLSYQGRDDRALQAAYGRIVSRLSEAAAPSRPSTPKAGGKIRVGFVTSFQPMHSVSKTHSGWMKHLNRERFEVFVYHIAAANDAVKQAATGFDAFHSGDRKWEEWRAQIEADAPHVLIYLELGMQTVPVQLASRRISPVQCTTWGHPVTSGLPTVDYFLSSDLMEPEDGDAHYTEKLVRLPNLSIAYDQVPPSNTVLKRADVGLRPDAVVYTCCQALYKYLPRYDSVLIAIAKAVPDSQFVFLGGPERLPTQRLRARLEGAFREAGLDPQKHLVMAPTVPFEVFSAFLMLGDVFLDSFEWSGCNTTLEALTCGLPVITLPGRMMRGRHGYAILKFLGLDECIVPDTDAYVALAARLADPAEREKLKARVAADRHRLYGDMAPIRALEDFLETAVAQHA